MLSPQSSRVLSRAFGTLLFTLLATGAQAQLVASGPVNINGQSGTVIQNLHVTNPNGDCITLSNSSNITIRASEIGPCKGNGIVITGGTSISVLDNYIHPEGPLAGCCDFTDGIFTNGTSNLTVQGNVIAYGEANIEAAGQTNIKIVGNFFLNPRGGANHRGQNIQVWNNNSSVTVQDNYTLASTDTTTYKFAEVQEDSINFGPNTGGIVVQGNYVTGGHSPTGCGIIADTGVLSGQFLSNSLLNTGECGIGITSGVNVVVDSNRVLNTTPVSGGGNTAIYVWKVVSSDSCGPVQVSNNIASAITISGAPDSYFDGGGCAPVTLTGNTFNLAAATLLSPSTSKLPTPPIPPGPASCVAPSPFSNNTAFAPCAPGTTAIAFGHVVIVLGEDKNASDAESGMPWLDALGAQYSTATQFYATTHPSVGNYLNMVTGQDITNDDTVVPLTFPVSADNVVRELIASGKSWKQYAESIPSAGYLGADSICCGGQYYARHVPLAYLADAQASAQVTNIVPFTQFATDLANDALPNYSFVTPNGCDDAHDCSILTFDNWLKTNIAPLLSNSQFLQNGVLIVTWDESANDNTNGGGRVQFVLAGPTVKTAYSSPNLYQWPSLCRLSLEGLDVPTFPSACATAPSMLEFFGNSAPPAPTTENLSATSLTFPSQVINTTSPAQTVTLTNSGAASLDITSIVPTGDFAQGTNCGTSVAAGANCTISVEFTPTATGTRTGAITITDNAAGSPHIVSLTGPGSVAMTSSVRLTGKFTEAMSGSTSVYSQTVTNTGFAISTGDLIVVIVRIANSGESATSCSDNVNPGKYIQAHYQEDKSNGRAMIQYYMANSAPSPSGSLTITCQYPVANHSYLGALDYSGAATSSPLDGHIGTTFSTTTTSPTSGNITPTQTGDLFVGSVYISEGSTVTVSSESAGLTTELKGNEGTANFQHSHTADEVSSNTTAQNYNPTFSSSITTIDILTAYKASGGGAASVSLSPTSLTFASQLVGTTSAAQTVTLNNTGTAALNVTSIVASGQYAQTNTCGTSVAVGGNCTISVMFTPTATGTQPGTITVTDSATGGPQTVTLSGTSVAPGISFAPTSLGFANQNLNTVSAAQFVTLTNSGSAALNITSIVASAQYSQTNTCGSSVAASANCSISVTFTPTAAGSQPGTITVADDATGSPQLINLSGTGVAPGVGFVPTSLSFGNQNLNTTGAAQTVTLTNSGTAALTIASIVASTQYAQTNTCGASVAAGANCSISVTFTPTATGSQPGTITVTDNATGSPQTVALSGTGVAPGVSFVPTSLSFGNQNLNTTSAAQTVTLSNTGTASLSVTSIVASAQYAQANTCGTSVAAGSNCMISVKFTPTATGSLSGTITVTDSATGSPQTVALSGTGVAPGVSFVPTSLSFGNQNLNTTSAAQTVTLSNTGTASLSITSIVASTQYVQTNTCGTSVAAGANCSISVTFTPTATGTQTGTITITDNASGSPHIVNLAGNGTATTAPAVSLSLTSLSFGNQTLNTTSAAQTVTLTNSGTATLTITSIVASTQYAQTNTCGTSVSGGANCMISVTFIPTATGTQTGAITIADNAGGSPQTVNLSGNGTAPIVNLSSTSLTFGSQKVGITSRSQTVTLGNTGTATLNINSIATSGDFSQMSTCGSSVAAGSSCKISVKFTPTATGTRTGAVTITDNAAGNPHIVSLTGSGK